MIAKNTKETDRDNYYIQIMYKDGTNQLFIAKTTGEWQEFRAVSDKNKTIERVGFTFGNTNTHWCFDKSSFFISEGEAMDYIPHEGQAITMPCQKPMFEGDYFAEDGEHHKMAKVVFDGTENWQYSFGYCLRIEKENVLGLEDMQKIGNIKCTHLKANSQAKLQTGLIDKGISVRVLDVQGLVIRNSDFNTKEEYIAWLKEEYAKGTPVTAVYEMIEEEILPYTPEQIEVLEQLKSLKAYKNETIIYSTDEVAPNLEVSYRKDLETLQKQQNERLTAIEELLGTTATSASLLENLEQDLEKEVNNL